MKLTVYALALCLALPMAGMPQMNLKGRVTSSAGNKAGDKIDEGIDKGIDKGVEKVGKMFKKKDKSKNKSTANENGSLASSNGSQNSASQGSAGSPAGGNGTSGDDNKQAFKAYNNYDFVAGEKILFEDNFEADQDGEFPAHWKLLNGQGTVNTRDARKLLVLTEGNFAKVEPRMKTESYLGESFTIEFDYFLGSGAEDFGVGIFFTDDKGDDGYYLNWNFEGGVTTNYFKNDLRGENPFKDSFSQGWHHAAMAYKNGQMKAYVDQNRILVVPNCDFKPVKVAFGGVAQIVFDEVKIADGGSMNMLNKLLTDGKFVTHGITFDVNKANIKPESMGVLNQMAAFLKANPSLKVEIAGHTDSDGSASLNQKLSQDRAEAVKNQLVAMGIDAGRMTTKGYGASKPISENNSPEGKANNRRVEFTKQ